MSAHHRALAQAIAHVIWQNLPIEDRSRVSVIQDLHDEPPHWRLEIARRAGSDRDPSDELWNAALSLVLARIYGYREGRAA